MSDQPAAPKAAAGPDVVTPPPAAKPPPQITLNGTPRPFKAGETVIQFAKRHGVDIPYYCWHPRLSIAANCRMCLVEVEKAPKLVPACQTECKDGMVVHTESGKVAAARRAVHEFLLVNHPIDCPICDQAGECKLQDYFMKFQLQPSRMREVKVHKTKLVPLGPHVMYNAERCIVCTRCVRFMDEVAKNRQLGVIGRGDHSVIGTFPGQVLDDPYALNTVDVCPVGALTSRIFRFKQRVWNLKRSDSICPGCARGCNVHVDQRSAQVYRLLPRENEAVNQSWLCDEGRLTYSRANDRRLGAPRVRGDDGMVVADTAAAAVTRAGALLAPFLGGGGQVAVALSLGATCEEALAVGRLARELFGQTRIWLWGHAPGAGDRLLRRADKNPNRAGIAAVLAALGLEVLDDMASIAAAAGGAAAVLAVGGDGQAEPLARALGRCPAVVHLAHADGPLAAAAHVTLPTGAWVQAEGSWVNDEGRVQALRPAYPPQGDERSVLAWLDAIARQLGAAAPAVELAELRAQLAAVVPALGNLPLGALPPQGLTWAAPPPAPRAAVGG